MSLSVGDGWFSGMGVREKESARSFNRGDGGASVLSSASMSSSRKRALMPVISSQLKSKRLHSGVSLYTSTVLRGTEIGTATPTSHRPSGFSSVTADAVIRVATSAGANREFAVRHSHQCRCPSRRGTLRSMSSARTGRRVGHSRLLAGLFTRILHVEDLRHVVCIVEPVVALPGG